MKKIIAVFIVILCIIALVYLITKPVKVTDKSTSESTQQRDTHEKNEKKEKEVEKPLYDQLSTEEKIGQLIFTGIEGERLTTETEARLNDYAFGGIIFFSKNIVSIDQIQSFSKSIQKANEKHPIPLFLGVDEEGGQVSRLPATLRTLPSSRAIGQLADEELNYHIGEILSQQMHLLGFNLDFAPVLDVDSQAQNPVIGNRAYSHDANLVAKLGIQTMKGLEDNGIVPVVKHFPGHGDTITDSHVDLPQVNKSLKALDQLELLPFKKAIRNDVDMIMTAHILLPAIDDTYPTSLSRKVVHDLLRDELGFEGVVITDDLAMGAIQKIYTTEEAAVQAVKAGEDLVLIAAQPEKAIPVFNALKKAIKTGEIPEERLNESVERILKLKEKYQLNEMKEVEVDVDSINEKVNAIIQKTNPS